MAVLTTSQPAGENRVLSLLLYFTELESQHRVNNLAARKNSPQSLQLQQKFLENIIAANRKVKGLSAEEKRTLQYLRHALRRNKALQSPSIAGRLLYSKPVNWLFNRLLGRQENFRVHNDKVAQHEKKTAIGVNVTNLTQEMTDHGFRVQLDGPLKRMMAGNLKEFALPYYDIAMPDTDYILHFKRMEGSDAYFMEKFDATHRKTRAELLRDPSAPTPVTVNLSEQVQLTAQEARQLAADRPLEKTIAGEKVFVVPDNTMPFGIRKLYFDLERELQPFAIDQLAAGNTRQPYLADLAKGIEREATVQLPDGSRETVLVRMELDHLRQNYELRFRSPDGLPIEAQSLSRYLEREQSFDQTMDRAVSSKVADSPVQQQSRIRGFSPNVENGLQVYKKILLAKAQEAQLTHGLRAIR